MTSPLLPGADLVAQGIADISRGAVTAEALLVSIGAPHFRALHVDLPMALPNAEALGLSGVASLPRSDG